MTTFKIDQLSTYIQLIKENLILARRLIGNSQKNVTPFDPNNTLPFYRSRAKHLQTMSLMGITTEYLLKAILLKRGFSILEISYIRNVNKKSEIKYAEKTITYEKAATLFKKSNSVDYYKNTKTYEFNTGDIDYQYSYLGYKRIDPATCVTLIQKIRNNYLHKADSHGEWNGIIWYVYDFIVWLSKKEFKNNFSRFKLIGNDEIKNLF